MSCHRCDLRNILACGSCAGEPKLLSNHNIVLEYEPFIQIITFLRWVRVYGVGCLMSTSHNVLVYHSGLDMEVPLALRWPEPLRAKVAGKKPPKNKHFRLDQPDASYPNPNPFACCFFGRHRTFSVKIDDYILRSRNVTMAQYGNYKGTPSPFPQVHCPRVDRWFSTCVLPWPRRWQIVTGHC